METRTDIHLANLEIKLVFVSFISINSKTKPAKTVRVFHFYLFFYQFFRFKMKIFGVLVILGIGSRFK